MYPAHVSLDRRLPDESTVRVELADAAATIIADDARVSRLHRVLYPVFRVTYEYESNDGLFGDGRREQSSLVDGLWTGNDPVLTGYRDGTSDPIEVDVSGYDLAADDPGLGTTVLLEFQATNDRAGSLLGQRMHHVRSRRNGKASGDPETYLADLQRTFGLPAGVDPDSFVGVTDVTRLHLPFWLAEFRSDRRDGAVLRSVRDPRQERGRLGEAHGWLASFVSDDPARLAAYGYEVDHPRPTTNARARTTDGSRTGGGGDADDGASAGEVEATVTQPEDVDLNAESLVTPSPDRGFGDVGGMTDLKRQLEKHVLAPIREPERHAAYDIDPVNGVLLYGPPGCGKTYIAGALAGELGHYFLEVTPADLTSKYMGEPAQNVADLFAIARANQPAILFVDELDALAGRRDGDMNTSEQQVVNQFLAELEDLREDDVVVVGATNLLEDIDPAIRRTGRFDERVEVPPPDADARRAILQIHLAERPIAEDLDLEPAVEQTAGYASSDLERIAEETARMALDDGSDVTTDHLLAALAAVDSSIDDWVGQYHVGEGHHVTQPEDADLDARTLVTPDPARTFEDVGGMDELKETLRQQVIHPVEQPDRFAEYGIDPLTGLLLYGPPGCGKTYLARALAGELGHYFLEVTPADLTSKWMGEPAQNVADLFAIARANQPCVLFVDELDALAGRRNGDMNTSERQVVNQLLAELEAVADEDVVVVGATNLPDDVDPAIRRSGRFDQRVEVPPPDASAREAIVRVHLRDRPTAETVDLDPVVDETTGHAASDLALLVEQAARRALRADEPLDTPHLRAAAASTPSSLANWDGADRYADSAETTTPRYFG